ncbi:MAG: hypothetical protein Q8R87_04375, partial [Anaerolineaceae bacterium]|nr:hypothetical protein [Anaerolineaceae bacterium]
DALPPESLAQLVTHLTFVCFFDKRAQLSGNSIIHKNGAQNNGRIGNDLEPVTEKVFPRTRRQAHHFFSTLVVLMLKKDRQIRYRSKTHYEVGWKILNRA